jgi:ribose-phosphate pyrophosphokinase
MTTPIIFSLPGNAVTGERLACLLGAEIGQLATHTFPDGESLVRVDTDPRDRDVAIVATLRHPNDVVMSLLFLADALRDLGAHRVGLIAPYLAYMRQDTRFHPGEAVTARTFASILSNAVDWLVTVDPHLHRFTSLADVYNIPATAVHVSSEIGAWISRQVDRPLIVGPDEESRQWAESVAARAGAPCTVVTKTRRGDMDVVESIPDLSAHAARTPVLVDDIISTARTMLAAVDHLREQHARPPVCVGVHAVFATGAYAALENARPVCIATTNTIPHPSNEIDVVPSIAAAARQYLERSLACR